MREEVFLILPERLKIAIKNIGGSSTITEIRLRAFKKVIVLLGTQEVELEVIITLEEILQILVTVSKNSIYAIQQDINNGFIVIPGGHRIGVCGEVVTQDSKIKNIKNINSMNIRIARQVIGCADVVMQHILNNGRIRNTLIISPPGCGKTTILRDTIRQLSNGTDTFRGVNVSVVDERGEIAAVSQGIANLDVGCRTDVMSNVKKSLGIQLLVRSMAPSVIATDEIGSDEDIEEIKYAALSGVSMIFTMHGNDIGDLYKKSRIKELIDLNIFELAIFLSNKKGVGTIEKIYLFDDKNKEGKVACLL